MISLREFTTLMFSFLLRKSRKYYFTIVIFFTSVLSGADIL